MRPTAVRILLSAVAVSAWSLAATAAPITFNTALPVAKGEFVSRIQYVRGQSGDDPGRLDRDRTAQSVVGVLGYGATRRLALFAVVPWVDKDLDLTMRGQRVNRGTNGIGDVTLFGRYTAYQKDWTGRTLRIAPLLGVKAPTGSNDRSDGLGTLPPPVQPGTGSWDAFGGLVVTWQTLRYQLDTQVGYRANGGADGFRVGNECRMDGSLQYRLWPRTLGPGVPGFLYGVIEANLFVRDNNEVGGVDDPDSGGTSLFIAPGIQYVTRRWILEAAVQLPVVQDLNGAALEADYIARGGLRFNF